MPPSPPPDIERLARDAQSLCSELQSLFNSADWEDRISACELARTVVGKVIPNLLEATRDREELVRIEAVQSLEASEAVLVINALERALSDKDELVRRQSAETLANLGARDFLPRFKDVPTNTSDLERSGYVLARIMLGEQECLEEYLSLLKSADYRTRCYVANSLILEAFSRVRTRCLTSLRDALAVETTAAAKSSIAETLQELEAFPEER